MNFHQSFGFNKQFYFFYIFAFTLARSGSSTITTKPAIPFVSASSLDTQITANTSQNIQQNTNKRKFDSSELNSIHQTSTEKYPKTDYNYSSYKDFSNLFANVYNNFIIYEPISHGSTTGEDTKSFQILQNSAAKQKISFNIDYAERKNNSILCTVQINGVQVTGGVGDTKKLARTKATDLALDVMRKCCFTIKVNHFCFFIFFLLSTTLIFRYR